MGLGNTEGRLVPCIRAWSPHTSCLKPWAVEGLAEPERGVLEEVRPELVSGVLRGLVTSADERTPHDHVVLAIEAWQREVVIQLVNLKSRERTLMVFTPLPCIPKHIMEAPLAWRTTIDCPLSPTHQVGVGRVATRSDWILVCVVPHSVVFGLREHTVRCIVRTIFACL